jgi:CRP-like cAMP-binding protein
VYPRGADEKEYTMTTSIISPSQNHLLASLPETIMHRLLPMLEICPMPLGKVLYESGEPIDYVWFPLDAIVSLLYVTEDGNTAEIALIGNDGIVGTAPFLGGNSSHTRAVVQSAGSSYCLPALAVMAEFDRHSELMVQILRYIQVLMTQIAQTAVCNRHHTLDQQLCRWLLLSLDRLPSDELIMTQELIANMLGVRREGVTAAAGKLQKLGVIKYSRGHIRVLDREKLQDMSCECYRVVKSETQRVLSGNAALPIAQLNETARMSKLRT